MTPIGWCQARALRLLVKLDSIAVQRQEDVESLGVFTSTLAFHYIVSRMHFFVLFTVVWPFEVFTFCCRNVKYFSPVLCLYGYCIYDCRFNCIIVVCLTILFLLKLLNLCLHAMPCFTSHELSSVNLRPAIKCATVLRVAVAIVMCIEVKSL